MSCERGWLMSDEPVTSSEDDDEDYVDPDDPDIPEDE